MANKRNITNSGRYKNLKSNKTSASESSPVFREETDEQIIEKEQDVIKEIQLVMEEGTYEKEVTSQDEDFAQPSSNENKLEQTFSNEISITIDLESDDLNFKTNLSSRKLAKRAKREAKKATYKKTTFKHKLKVAAVLMVLGIFTGSGLGVWYFNFALNSNVDYSADPAEFVQDVNQTLLRNFEDFNLDNKENWVAQAKSQGKTPADISPVDNYVLAEYNASLANSYTVVGVGSILTMGFDQYMFSERKFDGNTYSFVSISPTTNSFVGDIAICDIMKKGSNTINSYIGINNVEKGDTTAEWEYDASYNVQEYSTFAGVMVNSLTPYIIGEKTVLSSSEISIDSNGNYVFDLELNTVSSVLRYVKQVKRTGDLALLPVFSEIKQTITITEEWELVSIKIEEKYSAIKMGINAPISASMFTSFVFDEPVTLPSVPPA